MLWIYPRNNSDVMTAKMLIKAKKRIYQAEKTLMNIIFQEADKNPKDQNEQIVAETIYLLNPRKFNTKSNTFLKFGWGSTFRGNLASLIRVKQHMRSKGVNLSPGGNNKLKDRNFAQLNGVPTPKILQSPNHYSELPTIPKSFAKPISGANSSGCFYVNSQGDYVSVVSGKSYKNLSDGLDDPKSFDKRGRLTEKYWIEELISYQDHPAHDFKVWNFYGKAHLVTEIQRHPWGNKVAFWNIDGDYVDPHEVIKLPSSWQVFEGTGLPGELMIYQERLGSGSPIPFLGLDFLRGDDGIFLSEITPHPGLLINNIMSSQDRIMGKLFEEAQGRLHIDLLRGKQFETYLGSYQIDLQPQQ